MVNSQNRNLWVNCDTGEVIEEKNIGESARGQQGWRWDMKGTRFIKLEFPSEGCSKGDGQKETILHLLSDIQSLANDYSENCGSLREHARLVQGRLDDIYDTAKKLTTMIEDNYGK